MGYACASRGRVKVQQFLAEHFKERAVTTPSSYIVSCWTISFPGVRFLGKYCVTLCGVWPQTKCTVRTFLSRPRLDLCGNTAVILHVVHYHTLRSRFVPIAHSLHRTPILFCLRGSVLQCLCMPAKVQTHTAKTNNAGSSGCLCLMLP